MNIKRLAIATALVFTLAAPIPALAWGDAPTHPSILYDLVNDGGSLPAAVTANPQVFVQAAAAPDIAWTPLFRTTGRTYVHTPEFAESLLAVARNDSELAMAFAWGAHLAADAAREHSDGKPRRLYSRGGAPASGQLANLTLHIGDISWWQADIGNMPLELLDKIRNGFFSKSVQIDPLQLYLKPEYILITTLREAKWICLKASKIAVRFSGRIFIFVMSFW